nr:PREDICTED: protein SZT2-like [Bemisia tabaci]
MDKRMYGNGGSNFDEGQPVLPAACIYLLMNRSYHISRNTRAMWFLQHLNTVLTIPQRTLVVPNDLELELVVLSVIPQDPPSSWKPESSHLFQYLVIPTSNVIFLAHVYSAVFCLDMSPSISAVDIQHGKVMINEIFIALKRSVEGIVRPLIVPGSCIVFEPDIYVTVIAHTPFFTTPAQQVLVQGWQLTSDNLDEFLSAIQKQLQLLEDTIAEVSGIAHDYLETDRMMQAESEKLVGSLFEDGPELTGTSGTSHIAMVSPDSGFINLLRYGILALRLLPTSSSLNLIVVTDGMITLPDVHMQDSVLTQLRCNTVSCSFLHVGSQFHPFCCQGLIPYTDLMEFIASATLGAYIPSLPKAESGSTVNIYHEAFLMWSFNKKSSVCEVSSFIKDGHWTIYNPSFQGYMESNLLMKKHAEEDLNASLLSVLCCRLREGYVVKSVQLKDNQLDLILTLPWSHHIFIEYIVSSQWPLTVLSSQVHYTIYIRAPYEFLHDITCLIKKPFRSQFRQAVVSRFWTTIKTLTQSDLLLAHLDSASFNPDAYTLPDSIRSGMPLFYLPTFSSQPALISSDPMCPQFAHYWRTICLLDPGVWQKWLHTYRLGVVLQHDSPLPKYLHYPNSNGRFQVLQCRQAAATLYSFLKNWASFVLIENHSFVKFITVGEIDIAQNLFYILRVASKPPCAVIHIAFLSAVPGWLRHRIIEQLKEHIEGLTITQRMSNKECLVRKQPESKKENKSISEIKCCNLLQKPVEKILIRYERMPLEFHTVIFPDGTQPLNDAKLPVPPNSGFITTLSRYLHHRRWVWSAQNEPNAPIEMSALAKILATLTKIRLEEGFRFAHSTVGIINMVLEVQMKCCGDEKDGTHSEILRPCIIQYVLFPPHSTVVCIKSNSDDETGEEGEEENTTEIITECWIEPQHGVITNCPPKRAYMENLPYHQLADMMWRVDAECISNLLTFEHLKLMCINPQINSPPAHDLQVVEQNPLEYWPHAVPLADKRIHQIPFAYSLTNILPKCQQAELLFSSLIQDISQHHESKIIVDAPNNLLLDILFEELKTMHDRELLLNETDSKRLIDLIIQRERDHKDHPLLFTASFAKSSTNFEESGSSDKRKFSESESTDTGDRDPVNSDWTRMILWAIEADSAAASHLNERDASRDRTKNLGGSECSGVKPGSQKSHSKHPSCAQSSRSLESPVPMWRCYVKTVSAGQCLLTFIPASFRDVKLLMLEQELKDFKLTGTCSDPGSSLSMVHSQQTDASSKQLLESHLNSASDLFLSNMPNLEDNQSRKLMNSSLYNSPSSSKGWILDSSDPDNGVFDSNSTSGWDMYNNHLVPESPFRLRASSWDPVKKGTQESMRMQMYTRARTCSVGAKTKLWIEEKMKKSVDSLIQSKSSVHPELISTAITIPVYIYDCPVTNLIDALILKDEYIKPFCDVFQDKCSNFDEEPAPNQLMSHEPSCRLLSPEDKSEDSDIGPDETCLKLHCHAITQVYKKCFVKSLFKSLHLGYKINSRDIQEAVDQCHKAKALINITHYIKIVCGHLREYYAHTDTKKESQFENEEEIQKYPLSALKASSACQDLKPLHRLIKDKFMKILHSSFKQVPCNPDFFFCAPNWGPEARLMDETQDSVMTEDLHVLHRINDLMEKNTQIEFEYTTEDQTTINGQNQWEGPLGSVTTPDDARTSLLSNMDSNSIIDFLEDNPEEISPLFLNLVCSINNVHNCTINILPTCLGELVDFLESGESDLCLDDLTVTLDMICLTLPPSAECSSIDVETVSVMNGEQVVDSSCTIGESFINSMDDKLHEDIPVLGDTLQHLPDYQYRAVSHCVNEIEWLMSDEIAAFLLDKSPVDEETLSLVTNHVSSSTGRSSCMLEKVPLYFVFGPDQSMPKFLQEFNSMKIPEYKLKQEKDFYFLIKDPTVMKKQESHNPSFFLGPKNSVEFWNPNDDVKLNTPGGKNERSSYFTQDFPKGPPSNWSSIAAWHNEVSNLMESGLVNEDGYDAGSSDTNETCEWLSELEIKRPELPNFWLIMKVDKEAVTVFFHCRFIELHTEEVKAYRMVQSTVISNIRLVCKTVNQTMLLNNLHDTRICDKLLEPESSDDVWKQTYSKSYADLDVYENDTYLEATSKFIPGWFSCQVVWETHFTLHPRLKTGPGKPGLSRGFSALRLVLNKFAVTNRKNMFVYQDNSGNVFYLRLHENIGSFSKHSIDFEENSLNSLESVSRSSSVSSLSRKNAEEHLYNEIMRTKSGESGDSVSLKNEDHITLKVHGISEAGPEVKKELTQVLQNRLDDAVLEVVSVMLARNPMCKLSPEDVHFIQKPRSAPETIYQFSVQSHALSHLQAFSFYLRQNLQQFLHPPKYVDPKPANHFQDYSQAEDSLKRVKESEIFLYNQSPASGNKGIACIALALVDRENTLIEHSNYPKLNPDSYREDPLTVQQFEALTATNLYEPNPSLSAPGPEALIEFRIWKQGRVNLETLCQKLKGSVRHSLWDLLMELKLLTAPLTEHDRDDGVHGQLLDVHSQLMPQWMQFASDLGVPSVLVNTVTLSARHPIGITVKELNQIIAFHDIEGFLFYESDSSGVHKSLERSANIELSSCRSCLLIGRNLVQWKSCLSTDENFHIDKLDPKALKVLQKFAPLLRKTDDGSYQFVSRQRYLLISVTNQKIILHLYNWAKDRVESLNRVTNNLGQWLSARSNLLSSILYQKMGLFHNQPIIRQMQNQSTNPYNTVVTDVENLTHFPAHPPRPRSSAALHPSLLEAFRNTILLPKKGSKSVADPVVRNTQQMLNILKSDSKEQQKKLYTMWQTRGSTPNIPMAPEILELFIQNARTIHFCITPLLFLPRWRIQSAATRDHALNLSPCNSQIFLNECTNSTKQDEKWHELICTDFIHEYKQYLQTLGFIPIQVGAPQNQKGKPEDKSSAKLGKHSYLQKSSLGGILLFELLFHEPFFYAKLYALECTRLQQAKSLSPLISQFTVSFLDECDRVKISMHLHSFTYDYHLRCLHHFVAERETLLKPRYHITSFLDDFLKYYSKSPNYARSLVHTDTLFKDDLTTPPSQLFNYLLSNEKVYNMKVLCMESLVGFGSGYPVESEYVLVQIKSMPFVTYKDKNDIQQTDDFDVTVIITQLDSDVSALCLQYFILMTSRRELYPMLEVEQKIGKFRTVSTANPVTFNSRSESQCSDISDFEKELSHDSANLNTTNSITPTTNGNGIEKKPLSTIRQESVNYMGYYSSHEEVMQQLMSEQNEAARKEIIEMLNKGAVDCRTHILWDRLLSSSNSSTALTYTELQELHSLADVRLFTEMDPPLSKILSQPLSWYQALIKVLTVKYADNVRHFTSPEGTMQHLLILHSRLLNTFVMLTLDLQTSRCELSVVQRKPIDKHNEVSAGDFYALFEGVVNTCCYHLWTGVI